MIPTPMAVGKKLVRMVLLGLAQGLIIVSAALAVLAASMLVAVKVLR